MASFEEMKVSLRTEMFDIRMREKEIGNEETRKKLETIKHELTMIRALEMQAMRIGLDLSKIEIDDLLQFSSVLSSFCERYDTLKNNKGVERK